MSNLSRVLAADIAGHQFHRAHEYANYALAGATPLAIVSKKDGFLQRVADLGFAVAIPVHMHIGMNACITDYLPSAARGVARAGLLGATVVSVVGLLKINIMGPGVTQTVKGLWHRPGAGK
ncbi:CybS-domain-containing protein [Haematococcus lacustris]|nr:hypothetical protein QJQ45_024182 [Haematococcus lacustris]